MKRTIHYFAKSRNKTREYVSTVKLSRVFTRVCKTQLSIDGLKVDVEVGLDRWGRLKTVALERSPLDWL